MVETSIQMVVSGLGLIGKRHVSAIRNSQKTELLAVVDPDNSAAAFAETIGVPWYSSLGAMFERENPQGVILATPNRVHVENGLECIAAGCPTLVEKPIATSADDALALIQASRKTGVPLLVGHHRRHNPLIQKAREVIDAGKLGQIRAVHANCWMYKPQEYFDIAPWRKAKGAGPVSVNLVHDVDLIRYLCGDVISVQAQATDSSRGFENEECAAAVLRFANGAVGTINVSDVIVAPWSWELTARENPAYPPTSQSSYLIGGTHGSLSLPDLTLWQNTTERSWWQPISATTVPRDMSDPLVNQIEQFAAVISGIQEPVMPGEEGLKTLRVIEAIQHAAETGETVLLIPD